MLHNCFLWFVVFVSFLLLWLFALGEVVVVVVVVVVAAADVVAVVGSSVLCNKMCC